MPHTVPASRSRALITVPRSAPRRGVLATCVRAVFAILTLPVRLPVLAIVALARGVAAVGKGLGRGALSLGAGAGKGIVALLLLPVRAVVLLARGVGFILRIPLVGLRLLGRGGVGAARGLAWLGARAGRGLVAILLLPVRILALLARLLARGLMLALRLPFVSLRLLGRGGVGAARGVAFLGTAIAVPAAALAWGVVRYFAAGVTAVVRGVAKALAFLGRMIARGVAVLGRGVFATLVSIAFGTFTCVRGTVRLALRIALLPSLAARILAVALARGVRNGATLLVEALGTVIAGLAALIGAAVALVRLAGRGISGVAKPALAVLATREPQHAAFLPLATLAVLGGAEIVGKGAFPFATLGLLIVAAFAALALMSRPVNMFAVLLAWGLAVTAGWRAERVSLDTPAWLDALVCLCSLAALRSAYVAARTFMRESPAAPRATEQVVAHRRASRAIGMVLAAQCIAFTFWSATDGSFSGAPLFGELLLIGAGLALAWVVRSGQYVRTAQVVLTLGAVVALVVALAAQFSAFGAGQLFTAASLGAGLLVLLVAAALTVVVHTRAIDTDHAA